MSFDCCHQYEKCSQEGRCTQAIDFLKGECAYKRKLDMGINFYYKGVNEPEKFYITIGDRTFRIGKRANYGSYTYPLDEKERRKLKGLIDRTGLYCHWEKYISKCCDEIVEENENACCRVILTIEEDKYNIQNHNVQALKETTAIAIRNILVNEDFAAAVEYLSTNKTRPHLNSQKQNSSKQDCDKNSQEQEDEIFLYSDYLKGVQLDLFDSLPKQKEKRKWEY